MLGSIFKLKVKAMRYLTYEEVKTINYEQLKSHEYKAVKGE